MLVSVSVLDYSLNKMKYFEEFSNLLLIGFYLLVPIIITGCIKTAKLDTRCSQTPKYLEKFELPEGLIGYNNYGLALDCAKRTNRPLAIYFTAYSCINCEKFENDFLYQAEIKKIINDNFVFAILYLDDKRELPQRDQIEIINKYSNQSRLVKTIGQLNSSLVNKYEHSSQPSLFIAKNSEKIISLIQFNPDKKKLSQQLEDAIIKSNK